MRCSVAWWRRGPALVVLTLAGLGFVVSARAALVTVDPMVPLTNYWSVDWNVDGDLAGWTTSQITNVAVAGGLLTGNASGIDAQISLLNFGSGPDLDLGYTDQVELRIQVPAAYTGDIQLFYGVTNSGNTGISTTTRALTITNSSIPKDGAFHVYRLDVGLEQRWRGNLRDLRIDPLAGASAPGQPFAIDYVRVGIPRATCIIPTPPTNR